MLLSLFSEGRLPWSAASSLQQLLEMKRNTDLNEYSRQYGAPEVRICLTLSTWDAINYHPLQMKARPNNFSLQRVGREKQA